MPSSAVASRTSRASVSGAKPCGQRPRRDREGDVAHLAAGVDEPRHRAAAAELAVVGVRREDERALEAVDHARKATSRSGVGRSWIGWAVARWTASRRLMWRRCSERSASCSCSPSRAAEPRSPGWLRSPAPRRRSWARSAVGDRLLAPAALGLGLFAAAAFGAGAALLVRRPELVTPLALAAAPFRLPLDFGREHRFFVAVAEPGQLGRLLPLYLVLGAAALALAWRLAARGEPRARRSPAARLAARRLPRLRVALAPLDGRRARRGEPARVLPAPVRGPRRRRRRGALPTLDAARPRHDRGRARPRLRRRGPVAAGDRPPALLRAQPRGLEQLRQLLPRHLALPRPEPLRPPPRARDRRAWSSRCALRRVHIALAGALVAVLWPGLFYTYSQSSFVALIVVVLGDRGAGGRAARCGSRSAPPRSSP